MTAATTAAAAAIASARQNGTSVKPAAGVLMPGARVAPTATASAAAGAGAAATGAAAAVTTGVACGMTRPSAPVPPRSVARVEPAGGAMAKAPGPAKSNKVGKSKGKPRKKNTVGAVLKNWRPIDDSRACNVCLDEQDYLNNSLMQCARCPTVIDFGFVVVRLMCRRINMKEQLQCYLEYTKYYS